MILIERYVLQRVFGQALAVVAVSTVVVLVTQVLKRVNLLTQTGQTLAAFGELALMMMPSLVLVVLPFGLLLGALRVLNAMNDDSELHVLEAAGVSRWTTARPILLLGIAFSAVALAGSIWIEPWANHRVREIIHRAQADLLGSAVSSGEFAEVSPHLFLQVSEQLPGGEFGGILIADGRDPENDALYYAKRGTVRHNDDKDVIVLTDGEVHRTTQTGEISIVTFLALEFDLSNLTGSMRAARLFPSERSTPFLLSPAAKDAALSVEERQEFLRELHRRFSDWLYPFAFGMVAIVFAGGARSNRGGWFGWSSAAIALALLARGGGLLAVSLAGKGAAYATLAYSLPLCGSFLFGALFVASCRGWGHSARRLLAWFRAPATIGGGRWRRERPTGSVQAHT